MVEHFVDAKYLQCPGPITKLFNKIKEIPSGDIVVIEATDPAFKNDVTAWCRKTKNELISLEERDNIIVAKIKKA